MLAGKSVLLARNSLEASQIARDTVSAAHDFLRKNDRSLAIVGIGFGKITTAESRRLWKGYFIEADHPRLPEGSPDGGEFCSADGSVDDLRSEMHGESPDEDTTDSLTSDTANDRSMVKEFEKRIEERVTRRILRNRLIAGMRALAGIAADAVPFAGELFDAYEIAQIIRDGVAAERDVTAALSFVGSGPRTLESLYAGTDNLPFKSYGAFQKTDAEKYYGPAQDGYEYHHIVEQGSESGEIPEALLNSTNNIVKIPKLVHEEISAEYSRNYSNTGMSLRKWLRMQPYDVQRAKGLEVMRKFGIIK
jgi:hypothetical protein